MTFTLTLAWVDLTWLIPLSLVLMFYGFIFTMPVRKNFKQLPWLAKVLVTPPALFSWLLDIVLNLVILTPAFWEFPREWTMTDRMQRWKAMQMTRPRSAFWARRVCKVLNLFDEGHC